MPESFISLQSEEGKLSGISKIRNRLTMLDFYASPRGAGDALQDLARNQETPEAAAPRRGGAPRRVRRRPEDLRRPDRAGWRSALREGHRAYEDQGEANSRIRAALKAFLAAPATAPVSAIHPDFATVEAWVCDNESFTHEGDLFPQGRSAAIASLKWFRGTAFRDLTSADAVAALVRMPSAKRRSFRNALSFADRLRHRAGSRRPGCGAYTIR